MNVTKPNHGKKLSQAVEHSSLLPRFAVVFHADGSGNVGTITKHAVKDGVIQHGQYVDQEALIDLIRQAPTQVQPSSEMNFIPPNVLRDNVKSLVFYTKGQKKTMWTRLRNQSYSFDVYYPPLLYVVNKLKLSMKVYALGSNQRPHEKTRLYHAPLMNIGSNGQVCQGTARIPEVIEATQKCLDEVSSSITDTYFTHVNHHSTLRSEKNVCSNTLLRFWQRKSKEGSRCRVRELNFAGHLHELLSV